eukprot:scaffold174985_cov37-Tisochrysis_lutea.AAC.1
MQQFGRVERPARDRLERRVRSLEVRAQYCRVVRDRHLARDEPEGRRRVGEPSRALQRMRRVVLYRVVPHRAARREEHGGKFDQRRRFTEPVHPKRAPILALPARVARPRAADIVDGERPGKGRRRQDQAQPRQRVLERRAVFAPRVVGAVDVSHGTAGVLSLSPRNPRSIGP